MTTPCAPPPTSRDVRVLLAGLHAGDSLGSTSEFASPKGIPAILKEHAAMGWPRWQVGQGPFNWQPGDPTDDTDMALALCRAHVFRDPRVAQPFNPVQVAGNFAAWAKSAPADMGTTTRRSLGLLARGEVQWYEGGEAVYVANPHAWANGSLMRNGVVAGMVDSLYAAFRATLWHGMMTHFAPLPQICCAAQTYLLWRVLNTLPGQPVTVLEEDWRAHFREFFHVWLADEEDTAIYYWRTHTRDADHAEAWKEFMASDFSLAFCPFSLDESYLMRSQGFCLLTLQIAVWALHYALTTRLESPDPQYPVPSWLPPEPFTYGGPWVLSWVPLVGGDTDTYGAVAGPLIAAAYARTPDFKWGLPTALIDGLKGLDTYDVWIKQAQESVG